MKPRRASSRTDEGSDRSTYSAPPAWKPSPDDPAHEITEEELLRAPSTWKSLGDTLRGSFTLRDLAQEFYAKADSGQTTTIVHAPPPDAPDGGVFCATCHGARWLRHDVPVGHPLFGQIVRCTDCQDAFKVIVRAKIAARSNLSEWQQAKRIENFDPIPMKGVDGVVKLCAAYAADPTGWLVIHGQPGSGKTHLGLAITNRLIHEAVDVRWYYTPDLMNLARKRMQEKTADEFMESVASVAVLVLDEFGKASPTDYAMDDFLEPLIDRRYRNASPTVFTMIGTPAQIKEHLSESIGRRMEDETLCRVLHNPAPQWKPKRPGAT